MSARKPRALYAAPVMQPRLRTTSLLAALCLAGLPTACGAPPKEAEEPQTPQDVQEDAPPDITDTPDEAKPLNADGPRQVSGAEPAAKESEPGAETRDITPRECRSLGGKYGALTRSDEASKLSPKLTDKQRTQANESIDAAAQKLEARWIESCESSLVGKVAEEAALRCAMSAKNVAGFDTCLNGPK